MSAPRLPAHTNEALVWDYLVDLAGWWLEANKHRKYHIGDVVRQALVDLGDMQKRLSQGVLL